MDFMKDMLAVAETETKRKAVSVRTDNGLEFVSGDMKSFLRNKRIKFETSAPYVKEGNGIAERAYRILCDSSRALLFGADLTSKERHHLWAEAVMTACYLRNRVPCKRSGNKTPYELWFGEKPDVSHLRVFGSPAYVHVPSAKQKHKFSRRSHKCVFVGYE